MNNKKILKILTEKYNKDVRVIDLITRHPFRFIRDVISDPEDDRPIRLMYFGAFLQKNSRNKRIYYGKLHRTYIDLLMGYS